MERLDKTLITRGLMQTRSKAQEAIVAGHVRVNGQIITKSSHTVPDDATIDAQPAHAYVSRGALKLVHGLDCFDVQPKGMTCVDIGASTGGFTQVLLERDAARVVAVDVGRRQLHPTIRKHPKVRDLSPKDARSLTADQLITPPDLLVCDASFIGLAKILPQPLQLCAAHGQAVVLFKPQFEVGPDHVGRGGIVPDSARDAVEAALVQTRQTLHALGWDWAGETDSPIRGGDGNREILVHLKRRPAW